MAKAKASVYFAVLTPTFHGVFTSHDEFDDKIKDAPVSRVKGCPSRSLAALCLRKPDYFGLSIEEIIDAERRHVFIDDSSRAYAFVDGSFNERTGVSGYGGFIDYNGSRYVLSGSQLANNKRRGSLEAEVNGMLALFDRVKELDIHDITIHHDCMACQDWARGNGKASDSLRKRYLNGINMLDANDIIVRFTHIPSHKTNKQAEKAGVPRSKNSGMAVADRLAREAAGLARLRPLPRSFFDVTKRFSEVEFGIV